MKDEGGNLFLFILYPSSFILAFQPLASNDLLGVNVIRQLNTPPTWMSASTSRRSRRQRFGVRWQSEAATALWIQFI